MPIRRLRDLTGHTYGEWTVTAFSGKDNRGASLWHVRCSCGAQRVQRGWVLTSGKSTRCGDCATQESARQGLRRQADLWAGTTFGTWTILGCAGSVPYGSVRVSMWTCRCTVCGAVVDFPREAVHKPMMPVCRHGKAPGSAD